MDFLQPIKPALILFVLVLYWLYYRRSRSKASHRLLATGAVGLAVLLILVPDLATSVANALGVGRGVDLVFYFLFLLLAFVLLLFYGRISDLEHSLTCLARRQALQHARPARESSHPTPPERSPLADR